MAVAKELGSDVDMSPLSSSLASSYAPTGDASADAYNDQMEDSSLLLDAAVTLCALGAKQVFAPITTAATAGVAAARGGLGATPTAALGSNRGLGATPSALGGTTSRPDTASDAAQARSIVSSFSISNTILRGASLSCPASLLGKGLDLMCASDLVLTVFQRTEGNFSADAMKSVQPSNLHKSAATASTGGLARVPPLGSAQRSPSSTSAGTHLPPVASSSLSSFKVDEMHFTRDGILLSPTAVLGPLMKYAMKEVQRRSSFFTAAAAGSGGSGSAMLTPRADAAGLGGSVGRRAASAVAAAAATDVEELAEVLQRSENHMLAIRMLLSSWHSSPTKSQVGLLLIIFYLPQVTQ